MLENIYTTKMSANKKQLQNRFTKIRSSSGRISKMMSIVMAIFVATTFVCATVVLASVVNEVPEQFEFEIKSGDTVLQLNNTPCVYDNTVYLPLRELMGKIGLLDMENSYINWDNGKIEMLLIEKTTNAEQADAEIKYLSYNYEIEIGKTEYTLNPSMGEVYQEKWNMSNKKQMNHAPMIKDGVTYIPFEFVEYLINKPMKTCDVTCSVWDLAYNKDTDRKADYFLQSDSGKSVLVTNTKNTSALYEKTAAFLQQEFYRVYEQYYDIQRLTISNWHENGNEATFFYKMTYLYYNREPDTVEYIQEAKNQGQEKYEILYNDYLALKEANHEFKVVLNEDNIELYSNVAPKGTEWAPIKIDDYIVSN